MNKYCAKVYRSSGNPLVKLRAAIVRESCHFPNELLETFQTHCNKVAGGLSEKVL